MKITFNSSVRIDKLTVDDIDDGDVDESNGVVFLSMHDAGMICSNLFGEYTTTGVHGIDARDEDGRAYLVLLR